MSGSLTDADIVTNAAFIASYPTFADATSYPPAQITTYLALANRLLNYNRWRELMPMGSMLWAAHFLTMDAYDAKHGGAPSNPISSKSVGSASISYDTTSASEMGAGHWNSSSFGRRFFHFAMMAGAGAAQIGGSSLGAASVFNLGLQLEYNQLG